MKAALVSVALLVWFQGTEPEANRGTIEGLASQTDTGRPLADVAVSVRAIDSSGASVDTRTDATGRFIVDVPAGQYLLTAQRDGFLPGLGTGARLSSRTVRVEPGQRLRLRPLTFIATGRVEGRVLDSDGAPAAGFSVELLRIAYNSVGTRQWRVFGAAVAVNDLGEFASSGLAPGAYFVRVIRGPGRQVVDLEMPALARIAQITYYPGVPNGSTAAPIDVVPGGTAVANMRVLPSGTRTIHGVVVNALPGIERLPETTVLMVPEVAGAPVEVSAAHRVLILPEGATGEFVLQDVQEGTYALFAVAASTASDSGFVVGRAGVAVGREDLHGVNLILSPGVTIAGRLTVRGSSSEVSLAAGRQSGGGQGTRVRIGSLIATGHSPQGDLRPPIVDGEEFAFRNVPAGTYAVLPAVIGSSSGTYVDEVRVNGRDGGDLIVNNADLQLEVIANTDGSTIQVELSEGSEAPVQVVLIPEPPGRTDYLRYLSRGFSNGTEGIRLPRIPPGVYNLFVWENPSGSPDAVPYMDPSFLRRYAARGTLLRVDRNSTQRVSVPLLRLDMPE